MIIYTFSVPIPCDVCLPTATSWTPFYQLKDNHYSDGFEALYEHKTQCEYIVSNLAVLKLDRYTGIDEKPVNESCDLVYN